jgi:hypothetical protein
MLLAFVFLGPLISQNSLLVYITKAKGSITHSWQIWQSSIFNEALCNSFLDRQCVMLVVPVFQLKLSATALIAIFRQFASLFSAG